jgi:PHD/YefM family antitoxin component YafN of YafNO toxin-antitoxin module
MMDDHLKDLLKAVEAAAFIVVTDRKGRAVICTATGDYVATLREYLPQGYGQTEVESLGERR